MITITLSVSLFNQSLVSCECLMSNIRLPNWMKMKKQKCLSWMVDGLKWYTLICNISHLRLALALSALRVHLA